MKKNQIFLLIALMFVTVYVFYPVINASFISLDDSTMVLENWKIKSLSANNLKALLFESHFKLYHPLVNLSYALEYCFFGLDPYFYHADNLILHLLNTLFVFFIFFRLAAKNFAVSFITACIFACHPMHVEPVAWVSGRKDILYAFFFLASWLTYLKAYDYKAKKYILIISASLLLFLCACLSKSMAVTLPAVLILSDWLLGKEFRKSLMKYAPYVLIAAVFSLSTYMLYYTPDQKSGLTIYTLFINFVSAHFNVLFYLLKFVVPVKLSIIYPNFFDVNTMPPDYILYSSALLYGIIVLILYSLRKTKKTAFGFAFFIVTILPVINILPTGISHVADRYSYIPLIGLGYILACGAWYVYDKAKSLLMKNIWKIAVLLLLLSMCVIAHAKTEKWHDTKTLFNDAIKNYPGQIAKAYINRANYDNRAEKDFEMALYLSPEDNEALFSLAFIKMQQLKYDEALYLYSKIPYDDQKIEVVYINVSKIYYERGDKDEAFKIINDAIKRFPGSYYLYERLAVLHEYNEEYDEAIKNFTKSKKLNPGNESTYLHLARIYIILKKYALAEKEYKEGILNCQNNNNLRRGLTEFYFGFRDYVNASVILMQTIKKYPYDYESYVLLGRIENLMKNYKKALYYNTFAVLLKNDYAEAYFNRAETHLETGNYLKSAEDAKKARSFGLDISSSYIKKLKDKSGISL